MDRILAMSLIGAAPGNVFGPGMSAGALESFARDGRGKAEGGSRAPAGSARLAPGKGGEGAAERAREAGAKGGNDQQEGSGAGAKARFHPASDGMYCFETVAPH
ncbi:uncharacterized protein LOC133930034 [Phragmites australis]|uniref:uncharacterized protein LOC133930034 n=1 Tax=Phragmites australis TaxID=29695 RepID=UPI002D78E3D7|nr:uncharacterized protein LOC133930034 [Phragmites australis]